MRRQNQELRWKCIFWFVTVGYCLGWADLLPGARWPVSLPSDLVEHRLSMCGVQTQLKAFEDTYWAMAGAKSHRVDETGHVQLHRFQNVWRCRPTSMSVLLMHVDAPMFGVHGGFGHEKGVTEPTPDVTPPPFRPIFDCPHARCMHHITGLIGFRDGPWRVVNGVGNLHILWLLHRMRGWLAERSPFYRRNR